MEGRTAVERLDLRRASVVLAGFGLALVAAVAAPAIGAATSGGSAYTVPQVTDTNPDPDVLETTIVAAPTFVDIGNGITAHGFTYNGTIPGPEFRLVPGERVIVHFENHLFEPTGIHWHGIELANAYDGTPFTQNQVPAGGSFLYDFVAPRPGIYWYHPHHEFSTNQVFKGLYGSIIVTDPNEAQLVADGVLPGPADTQTLALSDITVCKDPDPNDDGDYSDSLNDAVTYDNSLPWVGGGPLPVQPGPDPKTLCEWPVDNHGEPLRNPDAGIVLGMGEVPNIQVGHGRVNEGQTVLTNGVNVGARDGTPDAPGGFPGSWSALDVRPGQGLRLQIGNTATTRYFRLRLTDSEGVQMVLLRVGGEGGLLNEALLDGTEPGYFDFGYPEGEILLAPGDRADVVVDFPADDSGVATLWTQDFQRTGGGDRLEGWAATPTVPVAHFNVTGAPVTPSWSINVGTALRSATGDPVVRLPTSDASFLDPATFGKPGLASEDIRLTVHPFVGPATPSIDDVIGVHDPEVDYTQQMLDASARWAVLGSHLQLTVRNDTFAHHPFHLHGFSIMPLTLSSCTDRFGNPLPEPTFIFPQPEFMDTVDLPPGCRLFYRVHLNDRPMPDGVTPGGGVGRWVFHCHIFFHHTQGMTSELVVVPNPSGNERPFIDVGEPVTSALAGVAASALGPGGDEGTLVRMSGRASDPDGDALTLSASVGTVIDNGDGTWSWSYTPPDGDERSLVYITASDGNSAAQTAFPLSVNNVAPTVMIDPSQALTVDEGSTLAVSASFTDPADDDAYTATIDFGDGSGAQAAETTLTESTPPQAGTVSGSHRYGDNGSFHVMVTVTDEDGDTGSAGFDVTVNNVDPVDGTAGTGFADVGGTASVSLNVTDPGSDDLTATWAWGDGSTDTVQTSLVNPPDPDPPVSPSVQPRDVDFETTHAFTKACLYNVGFSVADDDVGTDADIVHVVITAAPSLSRGAGFWQSAYRGLGGSEYTRQQLQCYLDIAAFLSTVFNEARDASTISHAYNDIFVAGLRGRIVEQLDRQLLTAWINYANGGVELDELLDTDGNGTLDATFIEVMTTAETVRNNPGSTKAHLEAQRDVLMRINGRDGL